MTSRNKISSLNNNSNDLSRDLAIYAQSFFQEIINKEFEECARNLNDQGLTSHRNGFKKRELITRFGKIVLTIPQFRYYSFEPTTYKRYSRTENALTSVIQEMYLNGLSTRKIEMVAQKMNIKSYDKSSVSRKILEIDEELLPWLNRKLTEDYPILMVDARYEKVREDKRIIPKAFYVVVGITAMGRREIISASVENVESYETWRGIFSKLKQRGLKGTEYIVSDAHLGLVSAIKENFLNVQWQRCTTHYIRNLLACLSKEQKHKHGLSLRSIWNQPNKEFAMEYIERIKADLLALKLKRVVDLLDDSAEDTLTFMSYSEQMRKKIKSTNMLERFNQELKRRSKVVRIFPNEASCLRLLGSICMDQSEEWIIERKYIEYEPQDSRNSATLHSLNLVDK